MTDNVSCAVLFDGSKGVQCCVCMHETTFSKMVGNLTCEHWYCQDCFYKKFNNYRCLICQVAIPQSFYIQLVSTEKKSWRIGHFKSVMSFFKFPVRVSKPLDSDSD